MTVDCMKCEGKEGEGRGGEGRGEGRGREKGGEGRREGKGGEGRREGKGGEGRREGKGEGRGREKGGEGRVLYTLLHGQDMLWSKGSSGNNTINESLLAPCQLMNLPLTQVAPDQQRQFAIVPRTRMAKPGDHPRQEQWQWNRGQLNVTTAGD